MTLDDIDWPERPDLYRFLEDDLAELDVPYYHTHDSRGSSAGYPDYVIPAGEWLLHAELKRKGRGPTAAQARWLLRLRGSMRLSLLVGGLRGVRGLVELVRRIESGTADPVVLGAASYRVQVIGDISPQGRALVDGDATPDAGPFEAAASMRQRRRRPGTRTPRPES